MTRACRALVDHAFKELRLNRVEIVCAVDNDYTVQCGNGVWKRRKNMDLWAVYDEVLGDVMCRSGRSRHL
jgi:hypothetical protein